MLAFFLLVLATVLLPPPSRRPLQGRSAEECRSGAMLLDASTAPHANHRAELDLVLYGATGFTGQLIAQYLSGRPGNFSYALGGRSQRKLEDMAKSLPGPRAPSAVMSADSGDLDQLRSMVRRAKVVISAAGPYAQIGSKLLQACAEEGVHYADLSGEFRWQRLMIDQFHSVAQRTGAKIVLAAGYDSMPFDLGAALAWEALQNLSSPSAGAAASFMPEITIATVVTQVRSYISGGTLSAMLEAVNDISSGTMTLQDSIDPYTLAPDIACPVDTDFSGWGLMPRCDRLLGACGVQHFMAVVNARVVRRSMELLGRPGVSYREGMTFASLADSVYFLSEFVLRGEVPLLPKPGQGPPVSVQLAGGYKATVVAQEATTGGRATVHVRGNGDAGYKHTAKIVVEMGLCLLDPGCHRKGLGGGILTCASAANTGVLVERLAAARHDDGQALLSFNVSVGPSQSSTEL